MFVETRHVEAGSTGACILLFFFHYRSWFRCRQPLIKAMYSTQRLCARCTPLSEWRWFPSRKGGVGALRDLLHVNREPDACVVRCVTMPVLSVPLALSRTPRHGRSPALLPLPAIRVCMRVRSVRMRVRMTEGMPTWMACSSVFSGSSVLENLSSTPPPQRASAPSLSLSHARTHACMCTIPSELVSWPLDQGSHPATPATHPPCPREAARRQASPERARRPCRQAATVGA